MTWAINFTPQDTPRYFIAPKDEHERCNNCGAEVLFEYDTDGFHKWVQQVWRTCECPSMHVWWYDHNLDVCWMSVVTPSREMIEGLDRDV